MAEERENMKNGTFAPWANLSATAAVICLLCYQITIAQPEADQLQREQLSQQREHFMVTLKSSQTHFNTMLHDSLRQQREFSAKELEVHQERSSRLAAEGHRAVEMLSQSMDKLAAQIQCLSANNQNNTAIPQ